MIVKELLPIRGMEIPDWDKHYQGLSLTGSTSGTVPFENSVSDQIIEYLLNAKLNILNYTNQYDKFYFHIVSYEDSRFTPASKGVSVLDQVDELVLQLCVHMNAKQFAKVNKHEALKMIAQLMLDSIPKYLFNRTDFDGQKFYDDILPIIKPVADGIRTFQDEEFPV